MVERRPDKTKVDGSIPSRPTVPHAASLEIRTRISPQTHGAPLSWVKGLIVLNRLPQPRETNRLLSSVG